MAATVSSGAAGDATTGFCHFASRIAWSGHRIPPNAGINRRITHASQSSGWASSLFVSRMNRPHPEG